MSSISAVNIKVNNLVSPLGISCAAPEFSWQVSGAEQQSVYRIICASSKENLLNGVYLWDSGEVVSGQMAGIVFPNDDLPPRTTVYYTIQLADGNGAWGKPSCINFFETGLASESDFDAQWVGFPAGWSAHALLFQKFFELKKIPKKARLYVASSMVECFVNGTQISSECVLQPAVTDYGKSYHVLTFDVTTHLKTGRNVLSFHVGNGWYGMPVLKYRLEADGKAITRSHPLDLPQVFKSPVSRHSIYGGEEYDARKELDISQTLPANKAALRVYGPQGALRGFEEEPIICQQEISPAAWTTHSDGSTTVDFGRNFTGFCRLKTSAPAGTKIELRFAEQLYPDGRINQENLQGDYSTDVYISSGKSGEIYEPHFTWHGFRYVEISELPTPFEPEMLSGIVLRSNCRRTGFFKCSDPLLNDIFEMMLHTEESNLLAVPTDCPQRTERMGWLNDMLARNEGALYLFDASNIYSKYLNDIAEAQDENTGDVPMTAPFYWGFEVDPVCSSFLEIALNSYKFYGKTAQLSRLYPHMKRYVDYMLSCRDDDGILRKGGFVSDWCPPLCFNGPEESPQNKSLPHGLVSTALMFYAVKMQMQIADIIGLKDDIQALQCRANDVKTAFQKAFFTSENRLKIESMAGYAIDIYCGLIDEQYRSGAAKRLAELLEANNFKHTTGNICTKYLLEVLSTYGYSDYLLKLISSTDYPGWGYMLANGATTVWERWEIDDGKRLNSLNHPMHSAPCVWMFRHLAGIKMLPESMGADFIELSPVFPAALDFAEAVYDSRSGRYTSEWHREAGKIIWNFTIPENCQARVKTADGTFQIYKSGSYQFDFEMVR